MCSEWSAGFGPFPPFRSIADDASEWLSVVLAGGPSEEELLAAVADPDHEVRLAAAWHRDASEKVLLAAVADPDHEVRLAAVRRENASMEVLSVALADEDPWLRACAAMHPNFVPDFRLLE